MPLLLNTSPTICSKWGMAAAASRSICLGRWNSLLERCRHCAVHRGSMLSAGNQTHLMSTMSTDEPSSTASRAAAGSRQRPEAGGGDGPHCGACPEAGRGAHAAVPQLPRVLP